MDGARASLDGLQYREWVFSFNVSLGTSSRRENVDLYLLFVQRAKKEYNLVLIHPDDGSVESWTEEGSGDKMRADFADFEPRCVTIRPSAITVVIITAQLCSVQKLLSFVKSTLKWRLMDRKPLNTWVHPKGRLVLLGDSCHPMLVCHYKNMGMPPS